MGVVERFQGCLVGVAVGDALGVPREELPTKPKPLDTKITDMIGGGFLKLKPHQITDDTEMTLCLARSFVDKNCFDPVDIANKFLAWHVDNAIGSGTTTKTALERYRQGIPWQQCGRSDFGMQSFGNGSVMRCSPVALLDYNKPDKLVTHSIVQSMITHPNPDCCYSAVFLNLIIAGLLHEKTPQEAYNEALPSVAHLPEVHRRYLGIMTAHPHRPTGKVADTIEAAVHSFLTTSTFEDALITVVNLGGDADTTGAITGALAGTYYGEKAIPQRWKEKLIDRHEKLIYGELLNLGEELYNLAQG